MIMSGAVCPNGNQCSFAHTQEELRAPGAPRSPHSGGGQHGGQHGGMQGYASGQHAGYASGQHAGGYGGQGGGYGAHMMQDPSGQGGAGYPPQANAL